MILSDLKRYLKGRPEASLSDIAFHLGSQPDAVRGMLETWISKGRVKKRTLHQECGSGCNKCDQAIVEIYSWND